MVDSTSYLETLDGESALVQGFKSGNGEAGYVFMAVTRIADSPREDDFVEMSFSVEDAHILSEEIRKHAEFAATPRTEEEK